MAASYLYLIPVKSALILGWQ